MKQGTRWREEAKQGNSVARSWTLKEGFPLDGVLSRLMTYIWLNTRGTL